MAGTMARGAVRVAERGLRQGNDSRGDSGVGTLTDVVAYQVTCHILVFFPFVSSYGSVCLLLDLDLSQCLPRSAFSASKMSDRPLLDDP